MDLLDQGKLLDAGFMIIRSQRVYPVIDKESYTHKAKFRIICKSPRGREWHILEDDFKNQAKMIQRMKELLRDPMIVNIGG